MILNENVPRRLSRWALLPVAALSVVVISGLTFAQKREVRVEKSETRLENSIQREVLRTVNQQLRESLGADYQVRNLSEIEAVVERYVRDQTREAGRQDRRTDRRRGDRRATERTSRPPRLERRSRTETRCREPRGLESWLREPLGYIQKAIDLGIVVEERERDANPVDR